MFLWWEACPHAKWNGTINSWNAHQIYHVISRFLHQADTKFVVLLFFFVLAKQADTKFGHVLDSQPSLFLLPCVLIHFWVKLLLAGIFLQPWASRTRASEFWRSHAPRVLSISIWEYCVEFRLILVTCLPLSLHFTRLDCRHHHQLFYIWKSEKYS